MKRKDYYVVGGLILSIPIGAIINLIMSNTSFYGPLTTALVVGNIAAGVTLIYAAYEGRRKWKGELGRLVTILSIGISVMVIGYISRVLVTFFEPDFGLPSGWWTEGFQATIAIGLLIAAYGFHELSKAPWYPGSFGEE